MIRIDRIDPDHPLYHQEVELRQRVLLDPIRIDMAWLEREFPNIERDSAHFVAVAPRPDGERVVGCALLVPMPQEGVAKLMQMAVDPQRQREGIGRRLVSALEGYAFGERGLTTLFCHARLDAVSFYQSLGWRIEGEKFDEAGISHHRMVFSSHDAPIE